MTAILDKLLFLRIKKTFFHSNLSQVYLYYSYSTRQSNMRCALRIIPFHGYSVNSRTWTVQKCRHYSRQCFSLTGLYFNDSWIFHAVELKSYSHCAVLSLLW